eukprot:scaffold201045_cov30-Tisochrysis_lutea.AAC.2
MLLCCQVVRLGRWSRLAVERRMRFGSGSWSSQDEPDCAQVAPSVRLAGQRPCLRGRWWLGCRRSSRAGSVKPPLSAPMGSRPGSHSGLAEGAPQQ